MYQVLGRNRESKYAEDKDDEVGLDALQNELKNSDIFAHALENSEGEQL